MLNMLAVAAFTGWRDALLIILVWLERTIKLSALNGSFLSLVADSMKVFSCGGSSVVRLSLQRNQFIGTLSVNCLELLIVSRSDGELGQSNYDSPKHSAEPANWWTTKKKTINVSVRIFTLDRLIRSRYRCATKESFDFLCGSFFHYAKCDKKLRIHLREKRVFW